MLKEAIDKILGLATPNYYFPHKNKNEDGDEALAYTDKDVRLIKGPEYPTIQATTLMALKQFIDADYMAGDDSLIHVASPEVVKFIGGSRPDGGRNVFCKVILDLGIEPQLGKFIDLQAFIIHLQTAFVPTETTANLLDLLSSIVVDENGHFEDKGFYQNITVKSGITTVENKQITPRVQLKPFRTFIEIDQPESTFLFRMRASNESKNIACAVFNCDGNAWRPVAMKGIADWIKSNIQHDIPILA